MVWTNDSGRMPLCEAGISGFVDIAMRPCTNSISNTDLPLKTCNAGISGFVVVK